MSLKYIYQNTIPYRLNLERTETSTTGAKNTVNQVIIEIRRAGSR